MRNLPSVTLGEIISDANNLGFGDAVKELEERRELSLLEGSSDYRAIAARVRILASENIFEHKNQLADMLKNFDFSHIFHPEEDKERLFSISNKVKFLMSERIAEKEKIINESLNKDDYESSIFFGLHMFLGKEIPKNIEQSINLLSFFRERDRDYDGWYYTNSESLANTLIFFYYSSIEHHWDLDSELRELDENEPLYQKFLCLYLKTKANNPDQIKNKFSLYDELSDEPKEPVDFAGLYMEEKYPVHIVTGTDLMLAIQLAEIYPEELIPIKNKLFAKFTLPENFKGYSQKEIENFVAEKYDHLKQKNLFETDMLYKELLPENLNDLAFDDDEQILFNHYFSLQKPISQLFVQLEINRLKLCLNTVEFCEFIGVSRQAYYGWKSGVPIRKSNYAKITKLIEQGLAQIDNGLWPNEQVVLNPDENRAKMLIELVFNND